METPVNPLMLTLQSTPQTGGVVSLAQPLAIELQGQNEFLATLQLMLGQPPPPALPAPTVPETLPVLTENQAEPALEAVGLPAIIAAQVTSNRQTIAAETRSPATNRLPAAISLYQGAKAAVTLSVEGRAPTPEIVPENVESAKLDSLSASSLRLLNTAPVAINADLTGMSLDATARELLPGQITQLSSSILGTGSVESQLVRTSVATPISQAPGQSGWDNSLGQRILWMTGAQIKEATIQLNPPELGQIQVRVSIDGDQTSVTFVSQHANVRDAIDGALPRLREMLGADGLNLAEASVNDEHQANAERQSAERPDNRWATEDDNPLPAAEALLAQEGIVSRGLVDTYV